MPKFGEMSAYFLFLPLESAGTCEQGRTWTGKNQAKNGDSSKTALVAGERVWK
jgi:hypothetical protein